MLTFLWVIWVSVCLSYCQSVTQRESHQTCCCKWWFLCCWFEKLPARTSSKRATQTHLNVLEMYLNHSGLKSNTWTSLSHSSLPLSSPLLSSQLNETAKQLMEIDKPIPANAPGPSSEPAPLGPCSPGPSPSASPSNGNGSGHRRGEGKKNAKKRHSFTALSVSQRAAQLNNRHSMEISHPVLISSSDPRAAARIQVHANAVMYTDPGRSFIWGKISLFEHKEILD